MVIFLKQKKRRITLQDVAKHAGVSTSTASLVIRNHPRISDATKQKVLNSIEELGYVYDRVAAKLRSQSSKIIGVIVTDISNKFISEFLIGVQQTLEKMESSCSNLLYKIVAAFIPIVLGKEETVVNGG